MSTIDISDETLQSLGIRRSAMLDAVLHAISLPEHTTKDPEPVRAKSSQRLPEPKTPAEAIEQLRQAPFQAPQVILISEIADQDDRPEPFLISEAQLRQKAHEHYRRTQGFRGIPAERAFAGIPGLLGRTAVSWITSEVLKDGQAIAWIKDSHRRVGGERTAASSGVALRRLILRHHPWLIKAGTTPILPPA